MKTDQKFKELFFESARTYARASIFYTPDILADRDHLYQAHMHLQTVFLFPRLSDKDRSILCRLAYLREWLGKANAVNRFGLSPQNLKQFRKKVRQRKSERIRLKQRLARSGLKRKLTDIQLQTVKERYLSLPSTS